MRLFGEDNSTVQPDEFFGTFDTFLVAFQEARHDNGNLKRKRDEEEKRAKQDAEVRTKSTAVLCMYQQIYQKVQCYFPPDLVKSHVSLL